MPGWKHGINPWRRKKHFNNKLLKELIKTAGKRIAYRLFYYYTTPMPSQSHQPDSTEYFY